MLDAPLSKRVSLPIFGVCAVFYEIPDTDQTIWIGHDTEPPRVSGCHSLFFIRFLVWRQAEKSLALILVSTEGRSVVRILLRPSAQPSESELLVAKCCAETRALFIRSQDRPCVVRGPSWEYVFKLMTMPPPFGKRPVSALTHSIAGRGRATHAGFKPHDRNHRDRGEDGVD